MSEYLYFDHIRETRGPFFVEYQPPVADNPFAALYIIFPHVVLGGRLHKIFDEEVQHWMRRYPVPLMVWALDDKEDTIRLPNSDRDYLFAWHDPESGQISKSLNHNDFEDFLRTAPAHPHWTTIYTDVPYRTDYEIKTAAQDSLIARKRQIALLRIVLTLWLAVIPAGYAVFEFLGPVWLGLLGLAFVLWKALQTAFRIWNRAKPSAKGRREAEKQRKMDHCFYHCERNPEGFMRLKLENFENDARERVRAEAKEVRKQTPPKSDTQPPDG